MKKLYLFVFLASFIFLAGCSKDFLKRYDKRIIGKWRITNVNRIGLGGNSDKLPFRSGTFDFKEDGTLTYVDDSNVTYQGEWEIVKKIIDDNTFRSLQVSAVDFATQQIRTEYYDQMNFTGTNHFNAQILSTFNTYITHFRR